MRFIQWSRQRRIAYPWHVCAASNDNWCSWSDYLPRRRVRRGGAQMLPLPDAIRFVAQTLAEHLISSWIETADGDED